MKLKLIAMLAIATAVLAACGGGSDESSAGAAPAPAPVQTPSPVQPTTPVATPTAPAPVTDGVAACVKTNNQIILNEGASCKGRANGLNSGTDLTFTCTNGRIKAVGGGFNVDAGSISFNGVQEVACAPSAQPAPAPTTPVTTPTSTTGTPTTTTPSPSTPAPTTPTASAPTTPTQTTSIFDLKPGAAVEPALSNPEPNSLASDAATTVGVYTGSKFSYTNDITIVTEDNSFFDLEFDAFGTTLVAGKLTNISGSTSKGFPSTSFVLSARGSGNASVSAVNRDTSRGLVFSPGISTPRRSSIDGRVNTVDSNVILFDGDYNIANALAVKLSDLQGTWVSDDGSSSFVVSSTGSLSTSFNISNLGNCQAQGALAANQTSSGKNLFATNVTVSSVANTPRLCSFANGADAVYKALFFIGLEPAGQYVGNGVTRRLIVVLYNENTLTTGGGYVIMSLAKR